MVMIRKKGEAEKIQKKILREHGKNVNSPKEKPVPASYLNFTSR